jgi:hypothetical protein
VAIGAKYLFQPYIALSDLYQPVQLASVNLLHDSWLKIIGLSENKPLFSDNDYKLCIEFHRVTVILIKRMMRHMNIRSE